MCHYFGDKRRRMLKRPLFWLSWAEPVSDAVGIRCFFAVILERSYGYAYISDSFLHRPLGIFSFTDHSFSLFPVLAVWGLVRLSENACFLRHNRSQKSMRTGRLWNKEKASDFFGSFFYGRIGWEPRGFGRGEWIRSVRAKNNPVKGV